MIFRFWKFGIARLSLMLLLQFPYGSYPESSSFSIQMQFLNNLFDILIISFYFYPPSFSIAHFCFNQDIATYICDIAFITKPQILHQSYIFCLLQIFCSSYFLLVIGQCSWLLAGWQFGRLFVEGCLLAGGSEKILNSHISHC